MDLNKYLNAYIDIKAKEDAEKVIEGAYGKFIGLKIVLYGEAVKGRIITSESIREAFESEVEHQKRTLASKISKKFEKFINTL